MKGTRVLLSSWDEPRKGDAAYLQMDKALDYLQEIHKSVLAVGKYFCDLMVLTQKTATVLGLPPQAVTPLLAKTFAANLQLREKKNLLSDPQGRERINIFSQI